MLSSGRVSARLLFAAREGMARAGFGDWPLRDLSIHGSTLAWADFVGHMQRIEAAVGGPEGLRRLGYYVTKPTPLQSFHRLVARVANPQTLYEKGIEYVWPHLLPGVEHRFVVEGLWLVHEMKLKDELEACPQLWHVVHGSLEWLPVFYLKRDKAEVWLWAQERSATFYIKCQPVA